MQEDCESCAETNGEDRDGLTDVECESLFELYDVNGDGVLDHLEVVKMLKIIKGVDKVNPVKVMEAWDKDTNGQVQRAWAEFILD